MFPSLGGKGKRMAEKRHSNSFRIDLRRSLSVGLTCAEDIGLKSTMQDKIMTRQHIGRGSHNCGFIGLFDGHGPCGHNIAEYVSNELLNGLNRVNFDRESAESVLVHEFSRIQESMKDLKLKRGPDYEADESGTTASVVLLFSDRIVCANVGDSAIMIVRESEGENTIEQLSENHRPENPEERERIEKCGGRVDKARNSFGEFIGPHRVYMQDLLVPGLMLSRSLGDCFAHTLGVISDPFIKTVRHTPLDRALIVASDGIWDTISTQEVTNCILNVQANGSPAQSVVQSAKEKNATDNLSAAVCMLYSPRSRACLIL